MIFAVDCTVDLCGDQGYSAPSWFGAAVVVGLILLGWILITWEKDRKKKV